MTSRWALIGLASALFFTATASAQDDPKKFCAELTANPATVWDKAIYYRSPDSGKIIILGQNDTLYRHLNEQLFYFSRSPDAAQGYPGVLNIKFVYLLKPKLKPTNLVSVNNDLWDKLSDPQKRRIASACSQLTLEGYERFHLYNTRNYCLAFLFHQKTPFDTLATPDRRRSFAFADMIPGSDEPTANLFVAFKSIIARAQAAEQSNGTFETAPHSYAHSIIRNFKFAGSTGKCVEIRPISMPEDATLLHLRVTNLGIDLNDSPDSRDWFLQIVQ